MARLNQTADSAHATPVASRATDTIARSEAMSSPATRPLTFDASLQSHGTDNLPRSPLRRSSGRSSFSPADCRTLEKILRSASVSSSPLTPSPLDQREQQFPDYPSSAIVPKSYTPDDDSYRFVGGEATDTGYEDEDDSMELSEGMEGATASDTLAVLNDPTSPSVSKSDRRLQDSVSTHDEKDRLRYTGRQSSVTKQPRTKRRKKSDKASAVPEGNTIEDITNLPEKRASTSRLSHLMNDDSDRHSESNGEAKPLNSLRLSLDKVVDKERVEQDPAELQEKPNSTVVRSLTVQDGTEEADKLDFDGFDADKEDTTVVLTRVQRRKNSQSSASKFGLQASPGVGSSQNEEEAQSLIPNTPIAAAPSAVQAHVKFAPHQNVPETPFTKTLSNFKQFNGTENTPSKRRRNTALPEEIIEVSEMAFTDKAEATLSDQEMVSHTTPDTSTASVTSALADLKALMCPDSSQDSAGLPHPVHETGEIREVTNPSNDLPHELASNIAVDEEPREDETQKQLILYPQHPSFVNVIGMIPATMFWMTAAPIVRYTNVAVETLIEKLRGVYL